MRKELEERLFAIEPAFFERGSPTRSLMCFGFACGDGWFPLVEELLFAAKWSRENPHRVMNEDETDGARPTREPVRCYEETRGGWLQAREDFASALITRVVCDGSGGLGGHEALDWPQPSEWYSPEQRAADIEREGPFFVYYQHHCERPWNHFQVTQVKEKFGGLRFYHQSGDSEYEGMVAMAERMSLRTCEACGLPGTLQAYGWWVTLCDEHLAQRDNGPTSRAFEGVAPVFPPRQASGPVFPPRQASGA